MNNSQPQGKFPAQPPPRLHRFGSVSRTLAGAIDRRCADQSINRTSAVASAARGRASSQGAPTSTANYFATTAIYSDHRSRHGQEPEIVVHKWTPLVLACNLRVFWFCASA